MRIVKPTPQILHLKARNQYQLASTFMRLQEFYESPFKDIQNKYFTIEQYMDRYAEKYENFTYTADWSGFNVPGNVVNKFFDKFRNDLLDKETKLYNLIQDNLESNKYYLIGTYTDDTVIDHELSHAFYYLDPKFRKKMDNLTDSLSTKHHKLFFRTLENQGYCKKVLKDETQAYLATSDMLELTEQLEEEKLPWNIILEYKKVFAETKEENIKETEDA